MALEFLSPRTPLEFILPPVETQATDELSAYTATPLVWTIDAAPVPVKQKPVPLVWLQRNYVLTVGEARKLIEKEKQKLAVYLSEWRKEVRTYLIERNITDLRREIARLTAQKNATHYADERSLCELAVKEAQERLDDLEQSVIFYRYKTSTVIKTRREYDEMKKAIEDALQWLSFHLLNLSFHHAGDKMTYEPNPLPFVWYDAPPPERQVKR